MREVLKQLLSAGAPCWSNKACQPSTFHSVMGWSHAPHLAEATSISRLQRAGQGHTSPCPQPQTCSLHSHSPKEVAQAFSPLQQLTAETVRMSIWETYKATPECTISAVFTFNQLRDGPTTCADPPARGHSRKTGRPPSLTPLTQIRSPGHRPPPHHPASPGWRHALGELGCASAPQPQCWSQAGASRSAQRDRSLLHRAGG